MLTVLTETIIHGNDADFIQLESRYCTSLARNGSRKLDVIPAARMGVYRALAGDPSDNLPGVAVGCHGSAACHCYTMLCCV
jgi:hypothetical protein